MARVSHAAQIDLCFGDPAREFLDFSAGARPCNFPCKLLGLLGECRIGGNGQAQRMAKRVSR
jgi:hypothetical protein